MNITHVNTYVYNPAKSKRAPRYSNVASMTYSDSAQTLLRYWRASYRFSRERGHGPAVVMRYY